MTLLELDRVSKFYQRGAREHVVLREASLALDAGELAAIWGMRRSGRSTLLRVAAGIEPPDTGTVRFEGRDLSEQGDAALGMGIGYCQKAFGPTVGQTVFDQLMACLLAHGASPIFARSRARVVLERTGAERCAELEPGEMNGAEAIRVAIAQALAFEPRLLVIDEPTKGVDLLERDSILLLLRSLVDREGIAVLTSTGEATGLAGADRAISLGDGELNEAHRDELAPVVPLRRSVG